MIQEYKKWNRKMHGTKILPAARLFRPAAAAMIRFKPAEILSQ
jgi:hypothetical protein